MNRLLALAVSLLALTACASEVLETSTTSPGTGGDAPGGSGGEAGGTLPPCDEPGGPPWQPAPGYEPFACDLPKPCPTLKYESWSAGGFMGTPTLDPAVATCILSKLRDREVSALSWVDDMSGMGQYQEREDVFIVDAEHAVSNWTSQYDLDLNSGTRNRQILQPPAYFDGCLKLTDPQEIYTCLKGWSAGCADTAVDCPVP